MSSQTVPVDRPIIDVAIDDTNQHISVLQVDRVSIFQWDNQDLNHSKPTYKESFRLPHEVDAVPIQIVHDGKEEFVILLSDFKSGAYGLFSPQKSQRLPCCFHEGSASLTRVINDVGICVLAGLDVLNIHHQDEAKSIDKLESRICSFPEPVIEFAAVECNGEVSVVLSSSIGAMAGR